MALSAFRYVGTSKNRLGAYLILDYRSSHSLVSYPARDPNYRREMRSTRDNAFSWESGQPVLQALSHMCQNNPSTPVLMPMYTHIYYRTVFTSIKNPLNGFVAHKHSHRPHPLSSLAEPSEQGRYNYGLTPQGGNQQNTD